MTRLSIGTDRHPRLALFLRTQAPFLVAVLLFGASGWVLGLPQAHHSVPVVGLAIIAAATVLALALPWDRYRPSAQGVLAALDLIGAVFVGNALYDWLPTVAALAALPAVWLGVVCGTWGVVLGVFGVFIAGLSPLVLRSADVTRADWGAAFVIPIAVSVLIVLASVLTSRYERAAAELAAESDRRIMADALSARIGRVMSMFAAGVDIGLIFLDDQGETVIFNEAMHKFARLAQWDYDADRGPRVWDADQVTPLPGDQQPLARVKRGETIEQYLLWIGPRGGQRALIVNGRPMHHEDGTFVGSMLVAQDITDIVRAGRAREDALATLAHELRTPLTSIIGYSDLLMFDDLPPAASARVEVISRNAEQLRTVTSVFLDGLHREPEVDRERVSVRELVDETVDVLRMTPGFTERELDIDVDPSLCVVADRGGIGSVLTNLLSNAVKFSRECDRIAVSAAIDADHMRLTVYNSGSPIDPEDLERIFDRFYRGGNAQRAAVPGTGIGLSVSRDIVAAHGGTLTADAVDDGASFTLCLPRD